MDNLRQEIADLQREKKERESRRKKEEEERRREKERNNCLDASIERLLEARNGELRKSDENKQQLEALRATRASLQYDALETAVDDDISAEDELALGAESADFQLVESRRKKAARKAAQATRVTPTPTPTPTPVPTPTPRAKTTSGRKTS